ncbi:MAG: signal peptidase I, partial [Chloroflexi bacterium]|nr:signal peptidase I [Chloroflexota bacterium]
LLFALVAVSLGVLVLGRVVPLLGHPTLVVAGPSMETAISLGSAVVLDQVPPASLAVGDVVSLRSGADRAIFTHRIVRLAEREGALWLETQGDANATPDPSLTPATAVIGRVGLWIPYAGFLLALYSEPSGIVFVVSLGMVLLLLGISLEAGTVRRDGPMFEPEPVSRPQRSPDLAMAHGSAPNLVVERSTAKEVVKASRARRARRVTAAAPRSARRRGA